MWQNRSSNHKMPIHNDYIGALCDSPAASSTAFPLFTALIDFFPLGSPTNVGHQSLTTSDEPRSRLSLHGCPCSTLLCTTLSFLPAGPHDLWPLPVANICATLPCPMKAHSPIHPTVARQIFLFPWAHHSINCLPTHVPLGFVYLWAFTLVNISYFNLPLCGLSTLAIHPF